MPQRYTRFLFVCTDLDSGSPKAVYRHVDAPDIIKARETVENYHAAQPGRLTILDELTIEEARRIHGRLIVGGADLTFDQFAVDARILKEARAACHTGNNVRFIVPRRDRPGIWQFESASGVFYVRVNVPGRTILHGGSAAPNLTGFTGNGWQKKIVAQAVREVMDLMGRRSSLRE